MEDFDFDDYLVRNYDAVTDLLPDGNDDVRIELSSHYAELRIKKYARWGNTQDLEEAIVKAKWALEQTAKDSNNFAPRLHNFGAMLQYRYERIGKIEDLEEAIRVSRQAVEFIPDDHQDLATLLNNLGNKLQRRYERTGKIEDLEEAIRATRQAIEVTPDDHPDLAAILNNLGSKLESRYKRTGKIKDLEEAIRVSGRALEVIPDNHPDFAGRLDNLGNKLESRYERMRKIKDLEEAIRISRQAVEFTPDDHPDLAGRLNNLGIKLESRYERMGKIEDLEEAIRILRQAVEFTPDDHPDLAGMLNNMGWNLLLFGPSSVPSALHAFLQAWNCWNANPFTRIQASTQAIRLFQNQGQYDEAYQLSLEAIDVLPRVHNRSLSRQDQQYVVSTFSGLATDACSLALHTGQPPQRALELLERGRAVILSLLMDDRSDISTLKMVRPDLYTAYESLRSEVNATIDSISDQRLHRTVAERRSAAIEELEECVRNIQELPNFDRFQKGPSPQQMQQCAVQGFIIVINITTLRSDAIIVSTDRFSTIPLPDIDASHTKTWIDQELTSPTNKDQKKNKAYLEFLSWLWRGCVKPVLDALRYHAQSIDSLPRVWWIGAGLASSLPFHAACSSASDLTENAYCRVISSYTPSIKALQYARERASNSAVAGNDSPKLLIVTMPTTPNAKDLPKTEIEKSEIVAAVGGSASVRILDQPDVTSVMKHLEQCSIAHFACHGVSDHADPSESGLLLQSTSETGAGAEIDMLSVHRVSEAHLPQARIAYLSACSTAENRASRLVDEVLHVVSGFQVAGFRHVIGCLWPSSDNVCVEVAKRFYYDLFRHEDMLHDDKAVAIALQNAVVATRNSDEYRRRPLAWAQFVHFGA